MTGKRDDFFVFLKHQKLNCVFVLPMKNHSGQPRSALCHTCSVCMSELVPLGRYFSFKWSAVHLSQQLFVPVCFLKDTSDKFRLWKGEFPWTAGTVATLFLSRILMCMLPTALQAWWAKSDTAFIFLTGVRFFFFNMESPYLTGLSSLHPYDSFALECNRACSCLVCLHCCHCIWGQKDETLTKYWTFRSCGIRCTNCREQLWPKVYCLSIFCLFFPLPKPALLSSMWNSDRFAPWVHAFWDWWNGVWVLIAVFEWAAGQRSECYLLFMLSVS